MDSQSNMDPNSPLALAQLKCKGSFVTSREPDDSFCVFGENLLKRDSVIE